MMNSPSGFDWVNGKAIHIDPVKAMFNSAWTEQSIHMVLAAFVATSFAVAGMHAYMILRKGMNSFHAKAAKMALIFASVAAILQPFSGDFSAKDIARRQPEKLAALEGLFQTTSHAELLIGGIPNIGEKKVDYALRVPGALSYLAFGNAHAEVKGLDQFPQMDWPPIVITHIAFQIMVAAGFFLALVAVLYLIFSARWRETLTQKWWLTLVAICTPLGFLAVEAGWTVTETGRQPWIMYHILRTRDAVSPMPGLHYSFYVITVVYILLSLIIWWLMHRQITTIDKFYSSATEP